MLDLPAVLVDPLIARALEEDVGAGDVTTLACVPDDAQAVARAVARGRLVVAGAPVFARVFTLVDASLVVDVLAAEGGVAEAGAALVEVRGRAQSILTAERVALNLFQRMTGIATMARTWVERLPAGSKTRVTDTRKTTPGLRVLERYAVRAGGAHNHRNDLASAVLIKDNHIVAAGGLRAAVERARARAPHTSRIEVEVDSLAQLDEALDAGAEIVLLDNMDDATVRDAVARARAHGPSGGRTLLEASGGITLDRVATLAAAGVDAISVGALTHSVKAADIGLDFAS